MHALSEEDDHKKANLAEHTHAHAHARAHTRTHTRVRTRARTRPRPRTKIHGLVPLICSAPRHWCVGARAIVCMFLIECSQPGRVYMTLVVCCSMILR